MNDDEWRDAPRRRRSASDARDVDAGHATCTDEPVLTFPQSRERISGRHHIEASRIAQPDAKRFTPHRLPGAGDPWISEVVVARDGRPIHVAVILETAGAKVVRETQCFAEPFAPGASVAAWAESMGA